MGGIGGNWRIIRKIYILSVHLLPFCFVILVSLLGEKEKKKNLSLITTVCHGASLLVQNMII